MRSLIIVTIALLIAFCGTAAQDYWEKTWNLPAGPAKALKYDAEKSRLVAGIDGRGIYFSDDGGDSWQESNEGLLSLLVTDIEITSSGDYYAATNGGGVFKLSGGTGTWANISGDLDNMNALTVAVDTDGSIFIGTWFFGGIYRSENGGENWERVGAADKDIHEIYVASDGMLYAASQNFGVLGSSDDGDSWDEIGFLSNDNGHAFVEDDNNNLYVGMDQGIYRLESGSWIKVSPHNGPPANIRCLYSYQNILFAGTVQGGPYRTYSETQNWHSFSEGMPVGSTVLDFAVDGNDILYAATAGGVYKSANFTGVEQEYIADFSNTAAYPNPFTESITISAAFSHPGYAKVKIYDQLGRLRETIFDGFVNTGLNDFRWDPQDLDQGIYLYVIENGNNIRTGKIIFQK